MALGKIIASRSNRRTTLIPFPGIVDDGSALTLDFTTGVLDSRLSFERLSPATFINSSGAVEWAAANMMTRSQSQDVNAYWNAFSTAVTRTGSQTDPFGGAGAVKLDYDPTLVDAVISRTISVQQGLEYTLSVWLRADSGTTSKIRLGRAASAAGAYFPTLTTTWQRFSLTFTATGGSDGIELRALTGPKASPVSFHVFGAQLEPGGTMRDYNPALLDVPYHAPRFDHDPTTLAPRGLLIEAQSTNRFQQSSDWTVSPWSKPVQITWDGTTYVTAPDGTNTAKQITVTSGSSASISQFVSLATNRTISLWIRAGSLTSFSIGAYDTGGTAWGNNADSTCEIISGPGSKTQQIGGLWSITGLSTTEWTRVQVFRSSTYSALLAYPGSSSGTITGTAYMWGMQMEDGNGASSLIPTGASTATRALDSCVMTGTNFSSWFAGATEGVLYAEVERPRKIESPAAEHGIVGSRYGSGAWLGMNLTSTNQYPACVIWPTGGFQFAGGIATQVPLVSKQAVRWFNANDITNFANGTQGSTNTAGTGTVTLAMLVIGANSTSGTTANLDWLNGCIRQVKFWPVALPDSQIIAITTP
jgi:hypothetical protein